MKYITLCAILLASHIVWAQIPSSQKRLVEECELSISKAELNKDETAYTRCGFDDEVMAFSKWSGFVSQKQLKKGMFELCMRHPTHEYGPIYCQKSADLGYGPALAELGHLAMQEGTAESALRYYTRALASKQLNEEQEGKVAEQLGLYYLQTGDHYAPAKGVAFMTAAAKKRSALANNAMGYLSYTGDLGVKQDSKEAFTYFWRAVLLDCPAAEENVGMFHLARLQKITSQTASVYMKQKALSCQATPVHQTSGGTVMPKPVGCDCSVALDETQRGDSKPYYLIDITGTKAKLKDKQGATQTVQQGQTLASGYTVAEIRKTVVILTKSVERVILNLMPAESCLSYCQTQSAAGTEENIQIKPYRITFTPNECQDIMYYAKALVDTSKPFIGKNQCASETPLVEDPLLNMLGADTVAPEKSEEVQQAPIARRTKVIRQKPSKETTQEGPKKPTTSAKRMSSKKSGHEEQTGQSKHPAPKGPQFYQFTVGPDVQKDKE